jgi:sugar lactone lactonase YvrE
MSAAAPAAELVWDTRCTVGEGCLWDDAAGRLLFCDIPAGRIHAFHPADGGRQSWQLPDLVASFGLCRSGRLIVALADRFVRFDPATGVVEDFAGPVDEPAECRLNDGKVGPDGCFWVGGMDRDPRRRPIASLYRLRPDGVVERKAGGYGISNGLAWSPDGTTMYHADTPKGRIDAWRFDAASGAIGERRVFATLSEAEGQPDGAAMDTGGVYWSAGVTAGCINAIGPDGRVCQRIALPVKTPTMVCFAGDALYVTSLRRAEGSDPHAGGLFRMPAPAVGAPIPRFAD